MNGRRTRSDLGEASKRAPRATCRARAVPQEPREGAALELPLRGLRSGTQQSAKSADARTARSSLPFWGLWQSLRLSVFFDKAHADQVLRLLFLILCSLELTFDGAENRQVHPEAYLDKSGASGTLAPCWFSCYVAEQNSENMMRHCNCRKLQKQSPNRSRLPCSAA